MLFIVLIIHCPRLMERGCIGNACYGTYFGLCSGRVESQRFVARSEEGAKEEGRERRELLQVSVKIRG